MTTLAPDVEGSVRSEGRVDESSFADALNAVNVLHAVAGDMRGEPTQAVDDAVFTTIEQVQLREDFGSEKPTVVVSGDDQEEGAGPEASSDHEKNVTFTELREPTDTIPAVASTGSLGSDVGAEAMFTTIKSPPMARTPTRAAGPGGARPSSAQKARMSSAERSTTEESAPSFKTVVAEAVRQHAVRELRRVILLLPLVLSMVGHREEHPLLWERWEVWFLRPLYLLVAARLFIGLVFKLLEVVGAYEMLPARATMLLNAFHGTPIITIVWLSMWPAVRLLPSPEGDAWKMLIRMPWRVGLNLLIGLGAGAYGLLQAGLSGGLSHLSSRHFEERVNQTVLSLRVVRIIFSEARNIAVRRQNKRRKANSRHNRDRDRRPSRPSNAMLSVTSGKSPGASPAMSANAGKPLPRGESTSDLTSEDGELFDTSIFDFREQYAVLVGAMGLGLLNTLAESRKKARKAFQLLLHGQLNDEQTSASAAAKAQSGANGNGPLSPPAFDDADVMLVRRSYIEHVCGEAAERKGGKLARMQVTAHVTSLFANKAVTEEEFVAAFERVYREQRLVRASIDSFDLLQDRIRAVATVAWALLFGVALVFIPDWGDADISDSVVVPIATSGFSVVYALGWLPYETVSGALCAHRATRPRLRPRGLTSPFPRRAWLRCPGARRGPARTQLHHLHPPVRHRRPRHHRQPGQPDGHHALHRHGDLAHVHPARRRRDRPLAHHDEPHPPPAGRVQPEPLQGCHLLPGRAGARLHVRRQDRRADRRGAHVHPGDVERVERRERGRGLGSVRPGHDGHQL